ncbi:probable serine/threonine-protein kinase WNK5 isoform X1 [Zingiber officinale]|uniref:probable serine/threonine-protein kinase WNK5 isoform X1 n=1 Tax=Zingiber officinale TaxID=94328 RepID=UPI001C4ACFC2|nr:probable serine/threonine-protein kinase WNK5 isoform X1 [Zingiber officinale]
MRPPSAERRRSGLVDEVNGYVETDPTGRYGRFDEMLGKGAMKTVYRAFDELNGIEVAWNQAKICDVMRSPEALERMYSEVHLLSSLNHDSIIKFHASWIDATNRTFNFITEMFTSGTLREYLQRYTQVNVKAVKRWARQILHGLVYLHGHDPPVIHRDLKCDNIFVNGHLGQVKIGDLGLAAMLRGAQCAHSVIGTPEFMAPEVYEEEYNELVDTYSFGMCVLEMLTSEYPYNECSNPAQIYKKVTSGKLPDAFHHLKDPQAKHFIGRCLQGASKRASAAELLLDPFLVLKDNPTTSPSFTNPANVFKNDLVESRAHNHVQLADNAPDPDTVAKATNMTITGKINPEDDTIFLKVQIAVQEGKMSNIYFPFDIIEDTPLDVANEMVKELDIRDREPSEIAAIIAQEITRLVPGWKKDDEESHQVYNYVDDEEDRSNHPFYYLSSPTSSQASVAFGMSSFRGIHNLQQKEWHGDGSSQGDVDVDDDISSVHSSKYSAMNYTSGSDQEPFSTFDQGDQGCLKSTKICTEESFGSCCGDGHGKSAVRDAHHHPHRRLLRNQSMLDLRSQLLHRALVEELNKRMFKTIGAVENIGFQVPCSASSPARCNCHNHHHHHHRKKKQGPISPIAR